MRTFALTRLAHHLPGFVVLFAAVLAAPAVAQEGSAGQAAEAPFEYVVGPTVGKLGGMATIDVPAGYAFVPQVQMDDFNLATGNLPNPDDLGAVLALEADWVAFFSFERIGYVPDDDREELDADALLKAMKKGDEAANQRRREMGLPLLFTNGWSREPYYDPRTNHLTWGLELSNEQRDRIINHQIRLLGRHGVMTVIVADAPETVQTSIGQFESMLDSYQYSAGNRYAEFRAGDTVAKVGLAALVLGGGAAFAAKTGLLAKLGKAIKPLILVVIAGAATVGRRIKAFFSKAPAGYDGRQA